MKSPEKERKSLDDAIRRSPTDRVRALVDRVELTPLSLGRWLLILGAIIVIRHFLEQVAGQQKTLYFLSYFIHYPLAYIAPLLTLSVVLAGLSGERIERVTKLMLFAWLLTLLPPLIDILFARTREAPELIGYLIPKDGGLAPAFLNLLNPTYREFQGTTAGIRIEAALGCLLGAYYVFLKTRNVARSILSFFVIYTTMFFFFALPPITVAVTKLFGGDVTNVYQFFFAKASVHRAFANATPFAMSDLSNSLIDLIVIAPILAVWVRMYDRERFALLRATFDPIQVPYHVLATFAGLVLAARLLLNSRGLLSFGHPFDVIAVGGILASALFTGVAAVALRKLHEHGPEAPPGPPREHLFEIGISAFVFATLFALSVSYVALTHVLGVLAIYYLYYTPPIRLSRFPVLGSFLIGGATVFSVLLGFSAYAGGAAALWLPGAVVILCLFVPTLALTTRDLWTAAADRDERWSIVNLLGEKRATVVGAIAVVVASLLPALVLRAPILLAPGVIVGALGFVLVTTRPAITVPAILSILAFALVGAGFMMQGAFAPTLLGQLARTSFAEVSRKVGTFELVDPGQSSEVAVLLQEGLQHYRRGDLEDAGESYRMATEIDPESVQAYVSLGSVHLRLERLNEAARAFRRAIALDPDDSMAHLGLGQTHKLLADPDSAIEELTTALELDPENAEAAYTLALIHRDMGDVDEEIAALTRTVSLDPRHSPSHSRLADYYLANEMYVEAVASLKAVLSGRVPVEHVHTRMAEAYYELGDLDAAENELRKEITFRPKLASPHANLARLLAEKGETVEARREIETAMELTEDPRLLARF